MSLTATRSRRRHSSNQTNGTVSEATGSVAAAILEEQTNASTDQSTPATTTEERIAQLKQQVCSK
jgi:anti-sigma28 factor (negative regulator of flagellin synthesis)